MNAVPQPEFTECPPTTPIPGEHLARERPHLAAGRGHAGTIPFVPAIPLNDDRTTRHPAANQREGERDRGQSERDSGNINGAQSAIESNQERKAEAKQENSLNYSAYDDGLRAVAGEGYEGRHRITQSICQHFESCLENWTWEHYLCGATCAVMTFLLVLEWF